MKRFLLVSAALVALLFVSSKPALAADVEVTCSTVVPTSSAANFTLSGFPNISGAASIRSITISNYDGAVPQWVDLYRSATSSSTAAIEFTYVVPASTTISIPIPNSRGWLLSNVGIKKSDTNSTVKAQIIYE